MNRFVRALTVIGFVAVFAACPPPKGGRTGGGGGGAAVDPKACGEITTSKVGKKLYAFLDASAALDRASYAMDTSVAGACRKMATELGVATDGDTKAVCDRAMAALKANLQISVKTESRLVTRTEPPVCTTDVDFSASFAAQCEAKATADINVRCEGECGGTCNGECDGTCAAGGSGGACNGVCDGTCRGSCSAECHGYADIDASVECKAAAEVRATVETTCTEAKVVVVREDVTVVDDTKFQAAMRAIEVGMPTLLQVAAKAELVAKSLVAWGKALGGLVRESGNLIADLGDHGLCVAAQLSAAFAAMAQVQVRIDVSIQVSAEASATAGAN